MRRGREGRGEESLCSGVGQAGRDGGGPSARERCTAGLGGQRLCHRGTAPAAPPYPKLTPGRAVWLNLTGLEEQH